MKTTKFRKFAATLLVLASFVFTGCDKTQTIEKAQKLATELRIYSRNIAKANNDAFEAKEIAASVHRRVNDAGKLFSNALDGADAAIEAVKLAKDKAETTAGLDFVERLIDTEVFIAFVAVVDSVVDVPPALKSKLEAIIAAIRITFSTIRALFADVNIAIKEERYATA